MICACVFHNTAFAINPGFTLVFPTLDNVVVALVTVVASGVVVFNLFDGGLFSTFSTNVLSKI